MALNLSLFQRKTPALNVDPAEGHITTSAPSTTTVTTTTTARAPVTISTMSTTQETVSPIKQVLSTSSYPRPSRATEASGPITTDTIDRDSGTKSAKDVSLKPKDPIQEPEDPLSKEKQQKLVHQSRTHITTPDNNPQKTSDYANQHIKQNAIQNPHRKGVISPTFNTIGASVNS
ncbi:hypothetical protein POWCR01_000209800 [Plasmodium ovale]|uniref:Uncharacterized protein n=1 Tax=Plasmodium ovale TaxID=36330 RepID=A0A1C3KK89_PLAOA|nr:hypothetical protein POWCR01_000209800 [Plasmodium ovale]